MNDSPLLANAKHILDSINGKTLSVEQRREKAIDLAGLMLREANRKQTYFEKRAQEELARMMDDPKGKAFTTYMTDQCFRSHTPARAADQLEFLISQFGIPNFLSIPKKIQLFCFHLLGKSLSTLTIPFVKHALRKQTQSLILPGEPKQLSKHLQRRREQGIRVNLNHLGEAILGETEAESRVTMYLKDLANPNIEYISIKISTIHSQLNLLGWEKTLEILSGRLRKLFRAAKKHFYVKPDGSKVPKFINLDMEEYRDLRLTVELFRHVLAEAEFYNHTAGIVLQSYLPDSFLMQQELTTWAMQRVANGGAPIKIRIVKGANLAMERVEASIHGWKQAPYTTKEEVDANFKRMMHYGFKPEHAQATQIGIASHNLFDIAYALLLRKEMQVDKFVSFEMLEGMADHIRRVVQTLAGDMLVYCPVATEDEFQNAVAYLVRRLDENTAPDNFLRHTFRMTPGTQEWQNQSLLFSNACRDADCIGFIPNRQQNRLFPPIRKDFTEPFNNEPDTDWSLPQNRKWAEIIIHEWSSKSFGTIPLVIGNNEIRNEVSKGKGYDPSFPNKVLYQYVLANENHLEIALESAKKAFSAWSEKPLQERLLILDEVAHQLRLHRAELIGSMVADTGKTIAEADIEVCEAIDFVEYYRRNVDEFQFLNDVQFFAKGPILVTPPWNFPCSIPTGGIIAALAAGNSVIFKPAPEAVLVGWHLANIFWKTGISKEVLQFFTCEDDLIGSRLIQDPRISAVILTGATSTAKQFLKMRADINLIAETGGKNAMIITAMADRDLAIKDLLQSAFSYAGQKCSACSLAILEGEVYDDPTFKQKLRDAASSLPVGSQWDLYTRINPLIHTPNSSLLRGLTSLEEGEQWLLEPKQHPLNPNLWSPGIKLGVKAGGFTHQTELFGPVLGIMRADNLSHAISLANSTPYGLTSGLHSLDDREKKYWLEHIQAGNCYINRSITGAIVRRQPFGGIKQSSFGPGAKAGGPNYVLQLMRIEEKMLPKEKEPLNQEVQYLSRQVHQGNLSSEEMKRWDAAVGSYSFFWNHYFSKQHDPSLILGQDNLLCYSPRKLTLRVQKQDTPIDILLVIAAALTCHAKLEISIPSDQASLLNIIYKEPQFAKKLIITKETAMDFTARVEAGGIQRIRLLSEPDSLLLNAAANAACNITIAPVLANGRLELIQYLNEISISADYHRYGYLGMHENENQVSLPEGCGSSCRCVC